VSGYPVICWLRRDLRLQDNTALHAALHTGKPVMIVFIFDPAILKSKWVSTARLKFMLKALESLDEELRGYGRRLVVRYGKPAEVLRTLVQETGATSLFFNIDYTPYARKRDQQVSEALQVEGIQVEALHDRLLVSPESIQSNSGKPYSVYTPFKNKWRVVANQQPASTLSYSISTHQLYDLKEMDAPEIPTLTELGFEETSVPIPSASAQTAAQRLNRFMSVNVYHYLDARNRIASPDDARLGTSFMSPYIRSGLISLRQVREAAADAYRATESQMKRDNVTAYMDEIIWHEFYTHVLWHFPQVKNRNFNPRYDAVRFLAADELLDAWKNGMTGYPIVDAAMRQMNALGWMHNRARMIVASFLTKHLLFYWTEGELYFMQHLLDGDLAQNNGGWQWAAGTGTDAQPYFRIFNPVSQSKKFDPQGRFIREWIPELHNVPDKFIHEPWLRSTPPKTYPSPVVDHAKARQRALEAYSAVKERKPQ
jgi:deoxyribodipyrimidine photo-lyase